MIQYIINCEYVKFLSELCSIIITKEDITISKNKGTHSNKRSFLDFLSEHRLASTIVIIIIYIFITIMIFFNFYKDNDTAPLEHLELSAEISSFLFIVVSSIIAVWQYYISCRNEQIKNQTEKVQKSIELLGYFKDNILDKTTAIQYIFEKSGISKILNCIDKSKIANFDSFELEELLTKDRLEQLKTIQHDKKFVNAVLIANEAFNLSLLGVSYNLSEETEENGSTVNKQCSINYNKVMNAFMSNFISETLNNLEYFAMYFTHNIADESVIYQSTHQAYIEITELLYYHICQVNTPNSSKFYTNLIELYNIWKSKQIKLLDKKIQEQRCNIEKGTYANNIN